MGKPNVIVQFDITEYINRFMDNSTKQSLGSAVVDEAKSMIASGQSPVKGNGRFQGYSDSYLKAIRDRLNASDGKTVRPVNLNLSGKMLDAYGYRANSNSVTVGIMTATNSIENEIAGYHNDGTDKMPQRQLVPKEGEEWAVKIMRVIKEIYSDRLNDIIKQSNK